MVVADIFSCNLTKKSHLELELDNKYYSYLIISIACVLVYHIDDVQSIINKKDKGGGLDEFYTNLILCSE